MVMAFAAGAALEEEEDELELELAPPDVAELVEAPPLSRARR